MNAGAVLFLLARVVLGAAFLYLGVHKAMEPVAFLKAIREYDMVPDGTPLLLNFMAAVLPWVEIVLGLLILLGVAVRGTALTMLLLLAVFSTAIALRAWSMPEPFCSVAFDCGCGTGVERVCRKLPENLGLMLAAGIALFSRSRALCLRGDLLRPRAA